MKQSTHLLVFCRVACLKCLKCSRARNNKGSELTQQLYLFRAEFLYLLTIEWTSISYVESMSSEGKYGLRLLDSLQ
ncbi:hypothetical protein F4604DRAFT_447724 [Suillus subluteus]|nr:hypothetical protein F4604DRAFT_447724 [Suillus subluteus]